MSFSENRTTADGKWSIPDAVTVSQASSCSYSSSVAAFATITSGAAFQTTLLSSIVGFQLGGGGIAQASFTSGSMYEDFTSQSTMGATVGIGASAACSAYSAFLDATSLPPLSSDFMAAVGAVDILNPSTLAAFFNNFGTHFRTQATFGGSFMTYTRVSIAAYSNLSQSAFAFQEAASLALLASIGVNISDSVGYAAYLQMMSLSVDSKTMLFATPFAPPPPAGGDPSNSAAWSAEIGLGTVPGPQIIYSGLKSIITLLTAANFPNVGDIAVRSAALDLYMNTKFCSTYPTCELRVFLPQLLSKSGTHFCPTTPLRRLCKSVSSRIFFFNSDLSGPVGTLSPGGWQRTRSRQRRRAFSHARCTIRSCMAS